MIFKMIALDWRAKGLAAKMTIFFVPLLLFFMGFTTSQMYVLLFSAWIAMAYSTYPFHSEEKGALNNLFLTLPVTRKQIVLTRYVYSLFILAVHISMGLAIMPVVRHFSRSRWYFSIEGHIAIIAVCVLAFAIFHVFMFPLLFRLGYQKGKMFGLYIPTTVFIVTFFAMEIFSSMSGGRNLFFEIVVMASDNLLLLSGVLGGIAMAVMLLSYWLSLRVYTRRDL